MMLLKAGLICVLVIMVTGVIGYEEFNCQDYPLRHDDPFSPAQTVRVCGAGEYEDIPKILRTLLGIEHPGVEKPAQHLLPPYETPASTPKFSNGFSQNVIEPYRESKYLNNFVKREKFPLTAPSLRYPYDIINRINSAEDDLIDFKELDEAKQHQNKDNLASIVDDISVVKQSVDDLQSLLKDVTHNMPTHNNEEEKEENINLILKLDPSLESLLKTVLHLAAGKPEEETDDENFNEMDDYLNAVIAVSETKENSIDVEDDGAEDDDNGDIEISNYLIKKLISK